MKVRKKPVVVEAWQVAYPDLDSPLPKWMRDAIHDSHIVTENKEDSLAINIHTLEGVMIAKLGDYVIKGVEGELYPVRKDIFEKTYEVVE